VTGWRQRDTTAGIFVLALILTGAFPPHLRAQARGGALSRQQPSPSTPANPYATIDFYAISNFDYNPKDKYDPTPLKAEGTIPAFVRGLDGQKVSMYGMAMPLDADKDGSHELILNASIDACGFGGVPRINEWAYVSLPADKKVRLYPGDEIVVKGTFHVAEQVEGGRIVGLFSITADSVR
jgi:hypothetical protein